MLETDHRVESQGGRLTFGLQAVGTVGASNGVESRVAKVVGSRVRDECRTVGDSTVRGGSEGTGDSTEGEESDGSGTHDDSWRGEVGW